MRGRLVIAVIALAAVACGGGGSSGGGGPAAPQSPTATEPGSPGSFETLREMQLAVEAAFILCNAPMKVYDPPEREGATAQADCVNAVNLLMYDPNDVQAYAAAIQGEAEAPVAILVGSNWIITCHKEGDCEKIQAQTGGDLLTS